MTSFVVDVCPNCGNLRSVCSDPERALYPQREMCYASAVRELTWRRLRKNHGDPGTEKLHPTDGMTVWASDFDLTPDDNFV